MRRGMFGSQSRGTHQVAAGMRASGEGMVTGASWGVVTGVGWVVMGMGMGWVVMVTGAG